MKILRQAFISVCIIALALALIHAVSSVRSCWAKRPVAPNISPCLNKNAQQWICFREASNTQLSKAIHAESIMNDCIWRPNEKTKYKIHHVKELQPYYMEDMAICGEEPEKYELTATSDIALRKKQFNESHAKRRMEQSKWSWLQPKKKDLVIFAELLRCLDADDVARVIKKSGYGEVEIRNPINSLRERTIRYEFRIAEKSGIRYTTILCRPVDEFWIKNNHSEEHHKNDMIWITTYKEYMKSSSNKKYHSEEYWIDCKNMEYQYLSDYWDKDGHGFTTPEYRYWKKIKPDEDDFVDRLYKGFCKKSE